WFLAVGSVLFGGVLTEPPRFPVDNRGFKSLQPHEYRCVTFSAGVPSEPRQTAAPQERPRHQVSRPPSRCAARESKSPSEPPARALQTITPVSATNFQHEKAPR